jgi:hypothetical protein
MQHPAAVSEYDARMGRHVTFVALSTALIFAGCGGSSQPGTGATGGASGNTGASGTDGSAGASASAGANGAIGSAGATGSAGANGSAGMSGAAGAGGSTDAAGHAGAAGANDAGVDTHPPTDAASTSDGPAGPSFVPAGYKGTPFAALQIPGRINAADYDRGGAGVAWCYGMGNCRAGTTTGDWYPAGSPPYRPPLPGDTKICSGAACDDNVGICRMNPNKPDKTSATVPAPAADTYLCYSAAGEWTKYTVVVTEAGTYALGGFMAVPQGGGMNLSFGATITTGNLTLAVTNPTTCGGGEYFHCWAQRDGLATVTFPMAGTYLMTLTQVGRFNADNFTFTKM